MTIFNSASGINFFQPRFINWSYRKRGTVHRIHKNTNNIIDIFIISTLKLINDIQNELNPHVASFTKGISYPPKNTVTMTALLINILMYSANK